jgi:hypothetical protein
MKIGKPRSQKMHKAMKPLTAEETKQTLTFFFPRERNETTPPQVTVMVRRVSEDEWQAGMAVCSRKDMFERREGRVRAFGRLQRRPFSDHNPGVLGDHLAGRCMDINQLCEAIKGADGSPVCEKTLQELSSAKFEQRLRAMKIHPLNPCAEIEVAP